MSTQKSHQNGLLALHGTNVPMGPSSPEVQDAIKGLMAHAHDRNHHFPGFDCIVAFLPSERLVSGLPDYQPDPLLVGKELSRNIANYITENDQLSVLAEIVLCEVIALAGDGEAMAIRILQQMKADQASNRKLRRPTQYVAGTESGLAVAVVIDDRFWTDQW